MLRKRGAAEAGAIFIKVDYLNGQSAFYAPAPQSLTTDEYERRFVKAHDAPTLDSSEIEARIVKQQRFDSDLWLIEVEDREGRHFLDLIC